MATLSITAASFLPSANAVYEDIVAGAALTRGQPYYLDAADSYKAKLADADAQASARVRGICATDIASGQRGKGVTEDPALVIGATVAVGTAYYASVTAGAIEDAKPASTKWAACLGIGVSTTAIAFHPIVAEAQVA